MKELTLEQLKIKVQTHNYTDTEWNYYRLWRFVTYKTWTYIKNWKIYIKNA